MDAATSIQVSGLEQPEVERIEVAERHGMLLVVGLFVEIEGFKFRCLARVGGLRLECSSNALQSLKLLLEGLLLLLAGRIIPLQRMLVAQLLYQLISKLLQVLLVKFESLPDIYEGLQGIGDAVFALGL